MANSLYDPEPSRYRRRESAELYSHKINNARGVRRLGHWLELAALQRALRHTSGTRVLDAPCGTGRIHHLLAAQFPTVVGLDSSGAMLDEYRKSTGTDGLQGDIFALPFPSGDFDWVVCHRLFHHFDNDEVRARLLASIARTARAGVVFSAWIGTPLARRNRSRRQTLPLEHVKMLISESGLSLEAIHLAAWPFQPKAMLVCRKRTT